MKVTKRGTDVKKHTVMWKIGGKWRDRKESYALARKGKIDGVVGYNGQYGKYIQSSSSSEIKLYDLPEVSMA